MQNREIYPFAVSVTEAASSLGLGLTTMKHLISSGKIASIRVGRRVLVSQKALDAFIDAEQIGGVKRDRPAP